MKCKTFNAEETKCLSCFDGSYINAEDKCVTAPTVARCTGFDTAGKCTGCESGYIIILKEGSNPE